VPSFFILQKVQYKIQLFLLKLINFTINTFAGFHHLFHADQVVDASNEHVNEFDFGESESISVGDIEESAFSGAIDSTSTSFL